MADGCRTLWLYHFRQKIFFIREKFGFLVLGIEWPRSGGDVTSGSWDWSDAADSWGPRAITPCPPVTHQEKVSVLPFVISCHTFLGTSDVNTDLTLKLRDQLSHKPHLAIYYDKYILKSSLLVIRYLVGGTSIFWQSFQGNTAWRGVDYL